MAKFCGNCGKEILQNNNFCTNCGKPVVQNEQAHTQRNEREEIEGKTVTPNIKHCPDGVYRWIYEYNMLRNPTILFTVWKVLGIAFCVPLIMMICADFFHDDLTLEGLMNSLMMFGGLYLFFLILGTFAYLIVAARYGWKYMVLFEMDDEGITHIQMQKQFQKAEAVGWLTAMAGVVAGSAGTAGMGLLAATHDRLRTTFSLVKKMKVSRRWHVIKLNEVLNKNQIYAEDEDFDFILDYIKGRIGVK